MDAVTKVEENEFGMRLEDLIPEVTGKDDLLQSYLKTQANSVSAGSQQAPGFYIGFLTITTFKFVKLSSLSYYKFIVYCITIIFLLIFCVVDGK